MAWNNGKERKKFEEEQARLRKEYLAAGMTEEQIKELYDFDNQFFNGRRREAEHTQSLEYSIEGGFEVADDALPFVEKIVAEEEIEELYNAIKQLEPQQQWLIKEIYFLQRARTDVAKELGVDESSVRDRLARIYKKLKKFLI